MTLNETKNNVSYGINNKKISLLEYLFVLVLIIYAGRGNIYVASISIIKYPLWIFIPVLLSGIMIFKWGIVINKQFVLLVFCFFIYFMGISIKYNEIRPTYFLNYVILFFVAYVAVRILKDNLFKIYEKILTYLAIAGLVFWAMQTIAGGDKLYFILGQIPGIDLFSNVTGNGFNIIIYSVQPSYASMQLGLQIPRNCGFAWEPGGFATYLTLAIFFNLFINRSDKLSNLRFWILTIALVSTQSTTGYVIFIVILIFYYLNKRIDIMLLLLPVFLGVLVLLFTLPFMSKKIVEYINEAESVDLIVEGTIGSEVSVNPQRFTSFVIAFKDFRNNPILGLGGKDEERWTQKIGANVSTISGIGNLLAQFGIVGFLFFIIVSLKSSFFYSKYYKYKGRLLFIIIFLLISISYSIILLPLLMSFWMFELFIPGSYKQNDLVERKQNNAIA